MGDLLAGTPEEMMAFTAEAPAANDSGGALQAKMEESTAFQSAYQEAFGRLQSFVTETNARVGDHVADASNSGRSYLETDEASASRLDVVDSPKPR
ncbi:hypothetical protein [Actinophytocola sp.]|uniref:hypothetical protein n=1 Tax=Actinophytocola sp. TaxID=1872138 RepID=UPI003D6C2C7F